MNQFVPQRLLRDPMQDQLVQRVLQGAIADLVYTDPEIHGRENLKMRQWSNLGNEPVPLNLKVCTVTRQRQGRRASVNNLNLKRERQGPGPLERGFRVTNATKSLANDLKGWVVGFHNEWDLGRAGPTTHDAR